MRLAQTACDWCFPVGEGESAAAYYRGLRELGFVGVEMAEPANWPLARAAGLEIVDIEGPGMEWGLNRVDEHDAIVTDVADAIETAAQNEIGAVVVFSGNRRGMADEEGTANCIAGLARLAPLAERSGVLLLFEVLNSVEHHDYQADSSRFAFEVVRAVGSPAVRVLFDAYHLHRMGEDPVEALGAGIDLVGHIHVAGSPRRDFPGPEQEIDYGAFVQAALDAGFRGRWGHEFRPSGVALDELGAASALLEQLARRD